MTDIPGIAHENHDRGRKYQRDAKPEQPTHMVLIHGLRGLAAIAVMIYHFAELTIDQTMVASGYLAVDLFFVMSGLVLTRAYLHRFETGMLKTEFILRRFIRLYPVFLIGTVLTLVAVLFSHAFGYNPASLTRAGASLFFMIFSLPTPPPLSPNPQLLFPLNGVYWSLFLEIAGSIAFAFIAALAGLRRIVVAVFVMAGVLLAVAFDHQTLDVGATFSTLPAGIFRFSFSFAVGMLIGRFGSVRRKLSLPQTLALIAVTCAIMFYEPSPDARWLYDYVAVVMGWPLVVWWASLLDPPRIMSGVLNWPGELSYALYAIHIPLLGMFVTVSFFLTGHGWREQSVSFMIMTAIAAILLAAACGRYLDTPARRILSAFFAKRKMLAR